MIEFNRRKRALGMSISDSLIKLAGVERNADQIKLSGRASIRLEQGWIVQGEVQDMKAASAAIQQGLSALNLHGAKVHLSVPVGKCFMRKLTLEAGSSERLRSQIDVEINSWQFLPFKSFVFDYVPLPDSNGGPDKTARETRRFGARGHREQEVLVFVTSSEIVEQQVALVKLAGLKPATVELGPIALHRTLVSLHNTGKWGLDEHYAMLHVEEEEMILSVFERGIPVLMHSLNVQSAESVLELEAYYQNHSAQMLSAEITRMLAYYQNDAGKKSGNARRLYLSGDIKRVQTMAGYLEKSYLGEILALPFHLLLPEETEAPYDYAVPVGLAMKGA